MADQRAAVRPPWGLGAVGTAFLVGLVGGSIGAALAVGLGARDKSIAVTAGGLVGEWVGFVGVPVVLTVTRGSGSLARDFGARLAGWRDVVLGVAAGGGTYLVVLEVLYPPFLWVLSQLAGHSVKIGNSAKQLGAQGRGIGFVVFAACVVVGAPIAEELFFRGLLQRALQRVLPGTGMLGIGAAATLFGLAHLGSTEGAALPALIAFGVVLGVLYDRTGRLGPGIAAHMTFNAITVIQLAASH
jgi:membrane protease YdiL (CAAX protease family)